MTNPSDATKPDGATFAVSEKNGVRRWITDPPSCGTATEVRMNEHFGLVEVVMAEDHDRVVAELNSELDSAKETLGLKAKEWAHSFEQLAEKDRIVALKDAEIKERNARFLRDTEYGLHVRDELLCRLAEKDRIIERLTRSNERMKAALEWYKERDIYESVDNGFKAPAVLVDCGTRAREALAEIESKETNG